jgi:antitoxin component YwqK of YwqJK toxin-antitoxin module
MFSLVFKPSLFSLLRFSCLCIWCACIPLQTKAQSTKKEHVKLFFPNGKLKEKGKIMNGEKHGTWLHYNPNGGLDNRVKYRRGLAVWQVYYNEKQQKTKMIDKNGKEIIYKGCNCKN